MAWLVATALAAETEAGSHGAGETTHGAAEGARHVAEGIPWANLTFAGLTLIVFVAIVAWFAWKPVSDAIRNRALAIRNGLDEAAKLREEAQSRFSDVEARLVALDRRIDEMKSEALADTEREAERARERAEADANRIRETAERTIREEATAARNELQGEASRLAVELARETLKRSVTREDQERLARDFLAAVKKEVPHD